MGAGTSRTAALVLLGLLACAAVRGDEGSKVPDPELAGMEPQVAEQLRAARAEVLLRPDSAQAWGELGAAYQAHRLDEEAAECYRTARRHAPEEFRWPYLLAVVLERNGAEPDELAVLFDAARERRPDYSPIALRKGLALSRRGRYAEAREALLEAIRLGPGVALSHRALGQVLLALGESEAAAASLERAAELNPRDGAVHSSLARAYSTLGLDERAQQSAERAARAEPEHGFSDPVLREFVLDRGASSTLVYTEVQRRIARGDFAGALSELGPLRERRPDDADVLYLIGVARRGLGRLDEAEDALRGTLLLAPEHVRARSELGAIAEERGRADEALEQYRRAQAVSPRDPTLLLPIARLLEARGDLAGLIEVYRRLGELRPDDPRLPLNLGTAWARRGEMARAEEQFREALRIDPHFAEAHFRLAVVQERLGRVDAAIDEYAEAARLDSTHPAARQLARLRARPASVAAPAEQRPEFERVADELYGGDNRYLGSRKVERARARIAAAGSDPLPLLEARAGLARALLETGAVDAAVTVVEQAAAGIGPDAAPGRQLELHRIRALAYMRQAEVRNCVQRHNAECCIFPLEGGGVHTVLEPAQRARDSFEQLLALRPDDLASRWLLNVMQMALGQWPEGITEAFRLPLGTSSGHEIGRFRDAASDLGVDVFDLCGGVIVDDLDRDGLLDIVTSTFDPRGPLTFYRNDGRGGFEDRSRVSRLDDQLGGLNLVGADYDSDGDVDVLVLRGAWLFDDGRIRNSLLRNDGAGIFTDVTRAAGLDQPPYPTQTAAWGDYDNDGDLDLYIGNESRKDRPDDPADYPSQLFVNDGKGTFRDFARAAGVTNDRYAKGVAAGDYDNDGDMDLYVSNVGPNRLYRNNGDGTFTDVARSAGVVEPAVRSFATWFFDYDNDGWLDLWVSAFDAEIEDLAAESLGLSHDAESPRLYRNQRDGTFVDVAARVGLDHPYLPMGANFGDFDSDGWLDVYLATGDPLYETLMPNVALRNDRGMRFQDVTRSAGLGHLQKGHGVAFADLDHDGDQDLYHQLGGFFPGDAFRNALFVNPGHGHAWLAIELVGSSSNRAGYGARVKIVAATPGGRRELHRAVGSVSSFGGSPHRLSIGLGDATSVPLLEVTWPRSGRVQRFSELPMRRLVRVFEARDQPTVEELKVVRPPSSSP